MKQVVWQLLAQTNKTLNLDRYLPNRSNCVLMYHSVQDEAEHSGTVTTTESFRQDIKFLSDRYEIVDLPEVIEPSDEKRVALTFDDGYIDFYEKVLPVLEEFDVPATVYVVTDFLGRSATDDWGHNHVMTLNQLHELVESDVAWVGNHTRTHPELGTIDDEDTLIEEIVGAKEFLEDELGVGINRFCYPFGSKNTMAERIVREHHEYTVGTSINRGHIDGHESTYLIPRINGSAPHPVTRWETSTMSARIRNAFHAISK